MKKENNKNKTDKNTINKAYVRACKQFMKECEDSKQYYMFEIEYSNNLIKIINKRLALYKEGLSISKLRLEEQKKILEKYIKQNSN